MLKHFLLHGSLVLSLKDLTLCQNQTFLKNNPLCSIWMPEPISGAHVGKVASNHFVMDPIMAQNLRLSRQSWKKEEKWQCVAASILGISHFVMESTSTCKKDPGQGLFTFFRLSRKRS